MTRQEWRWAWQVSFAIMFVLSVPYLAGALAQNEAQRFSGALLAVEDANSYIAKMGQGARGAWLYTLSYSTEPQRGALFYSFYLLLGRLAGPRHTALVLAFHAARILLGSLALVVSYRFLAEFLTSVAQRRLGFLLVALGGGLGWLVSLLVPGQWLGSLPVDFISPEAFSFLILFSSPHLALARALLLLALIAYLHQQGMRAGLALLALGFLQPLAVIVAWVVMAADMVLNFLLQRRKQLVPSGLPEVKAALRTSLVAAGVSALPVLYALLVFSLDPVLKQFSAQNRLPSPHPLHYLLAFGVLIAPGVLGFRWLWRCSRRHAVFAGAWLLLMPVLLYLPIGPQRRVIEGVQLPLVALAVLGLTEGARRSRRVWIAATLALSLPTACLLWLGGVVTANQRAEPVFVPASQIAVFDWLAQHAPAGAAVLSAFPTGNALPAYTPQVAYIGHGPETIWLAEKLPRVTAFYQPATAAHERRALLDDGRIAFVLYGPHERDLGELNLNQLPELTLRYENGDYQVYEVIQ